MENKNQNNSQLDSVRKEMYEEFFYCFYKNRRRVYWMTFARGLVFGIGTFLGGTIVIAIIAWVLSQFVTIPGLGDFIKQILDAIQKA